VFRPQSYTTGRSRAGSIAAAIVIRSETRHFSRYIPTDAESILGSITDGFFALDAEWRFLYVNKRAERFVQKNATELLGKVIWDVFPEAIGTAFQISYERARNKHSAVSFEAYYPPLAAWFAVKAYPTEYGGLAVYFRDITAEKKTALALRDSEERFRATFEQAPVGIALVDRDGRWLHVNHRLCEILGYTRKELLARNFQEITYLADLPVDLEQMEQTLRGEIHSYAMEKRYFRKGGALVWCHLTVSLVRAADQTPKYFISIIEDISARKEAESMLAGAAHELRLPLSHIKGFVSSLRQADVEWKASTRREFLKQIESEADRLEVLIEDLLERATRARSSARRRRSTIAPRLLVETSLERVRAELKDREIVISVPCDLPNVEVDVPSMERTLANLVHNAHKYSPSNKPVFISARVSDGDSTLEIDIDDCGPGVPMQDRERVFEPFYRRESAAHSSVPGKGLGLAICRSIIRSHAGRIWVEDRPGGGARFVVALPIKTRTK
jgi:PAS domain S-box-containing protein